MTSPPSFFSKGILQSENEIFLDYSNYALGKFICQSAMVYLAAGLVAVGSVLLLSSWLGLPVGSRVWRPIRDGRNIERRDEEVDENEELNGPRRDGRDGTQRHGNKDVMGQTNGVVPRIVRTAEEKESANPMEMRVHRTGSNGVASDGKHPIQNPPQSKPEQGNGLPTSTAVKRPTASSLMPPPPRPAPSNKPSRTVPKPSGALAPPPSTASTLRTPPTSSLAPTTSTLPPQSRPSSKKVLLSPGHSPLDWAHLTFHPPTPTYLRGASVPPDQLIRVPPSVLKLHTGRKGKDAWGVWQGKVYNLSPYMDFHPGGRDQLMRGVGREGEAERLFLEIHPWVNWEAMLGECMIGVLGGEGDVEGKMDEMD